MWDNFFLWWQSIVDFFYRLMITLFDFLKDFLFWVLDTLMSGAIGLLDLTGDAFTGLNPLAYVNQIPEETKGMMAITGFNEAISIIVAAIGIRFILQLIPFVRWGS
jgi:hypothetical protein